MNNIENIVLGLQIGFQLVAAWYVLKTMLLDVTPTTPYALLFVGFFLRSLLLVNNRFFILPLWIKLSTQLIVSVTTMVAFYMIFNLIKDKWK